MQGARRGYLERRIVEHQILEEWTRACGLMDIIVDILKRDVPVQDFVSEGVGWGSP